MKSSSGLYLKKKLFDLVFFSKNNIVFKKANLGYHSWTLLAYHILEQNSCFLVRNYDFMNQSSNEYNLRINPPEAGYAATRASSGRARASDTGSSLRERPRLRQLSRRRRPRPTTWGRTGRRRQRRPSAAAWALARRPACRGSSLSRRRSRGERVRGLGV